jgi:hypothetical protein
MTTVYRNADVRLLTKGVLVSRAAAALPSTTIGSIFTITGGRILIVSLTGQVVTLLSGTNSTTVGLTPTWSGTSAPAALSSAGVIPVAAGSPVCSKLDGGALIVVASGSIIAPTPWVAAAGAVTITTASTVTGTVSWDLIWIPLDTAAAVVAA